MYNWNNIHWYTIYVHPLCSSIATAMQSQPCSSIIDLCQSYVEYWDSPVAMSCSYSLVKKVERGKSSMMLIHIQMVNGTSIYVYMINGAHTHIYIYIYMYIYIYVCVYICAYIYIYTYSNVFIYIYMVHFQLQIKKHGKSSVTIAMWRSLP